MTSKLVQPSAILPIHFFKIIPQTNLEKLKIPNKFTERYGGDLSNPVFLKPPDSTKWEVHWTKQNGEVWFEKGWKEFAENYSLDRGHFLVFKYEGTSKFDVLILDPSALEIDYPFCDKNLDESDDEESIQFLGETPASRKAGPESPMFSSRPYKKMRCSNVPKAQADAGYQSDQGTKFKKTIKHKPIDVKTTQGALCLNWPRTIKAQEIAQNFVTSNPFFTVVILPCHFTENAGKQVPKFIDFEGKELHVVLQLGERSWSVKVVRNGSYRLTCGWPLFVKESELQDGDICVFELIDKEVPKLKVHVYKCSR